LSAAAAKTNIASAESLSMVGSCVNSLYVDWVQAAGGRAVVMPFDASRDRLDHLLSSVNGVLFPGGVIDLSKSSFYVAQARYVYEYAVANHLPLWASCQGFQLVAVLAANDTNVLETNSFDAMGTSLPLQWTPTASSSRFYQGMNPQAREILGASSVTSNLHTNGVLPDAVTRFPLFGSWMRVISTNRDRKGREFISTIEHVRAPIYAAQWHPERPQFDWTLEYEGNPAGVNHAAEAVQAMQAVANFFLGQARANEQRFPDLASERLASVYAYSMQWDGHEQHYYHIPVANSMLKVAGDSEIQSVHV